MPKLKPCPFCGAMPTLNESRYAESEYLASVSCLCVNDDIAESYFLRSGKTQAEASAKSISAWNNRPFEDSQRTALIAWQFQAAGAALALQRLMNAGQAMRDEQRYWGNLIGTSTDMLITPAINQAACILGNAEDAFDGLLADVRRAFWGKAK